MKLWFWRPDYFYIRRFRTTWSSDGWIGFDQGLGFTVLAVRWRA